jgi:hypothetical protein
MVNPDSFKEMVKKDQVKQKKGKEKPREIPDTWTSVEILPPEKKSVDDIETIPECSITVCPSSV